MLFACFVGWYNISRLWLLVSPIPVFLAFFLSTVGILSVLQLTLPVDNIFYYLFAAGLAVVTEIFTWTPWNRVKRNLAGSIAFVVLLALALVVWQLSKTDGLLCRPLGFQGHGFWHLAVATGIATFYLSLRSERKA